MKKGREKKDDEEVKKLAAKATPAKATEVKCKIKEKDSAAKVNESEGDAPDEP